MDSYLARLKDDVQCSLCNDRLTEPKILSCFHTFCKPCIKRHAELIDEVNVFKCPQCNSLSRLSELNSVEDLESSVLHSRMLKVLEFIESEKVCSVSQSHSTASWYCFDCNRSLCDECEKSHSLFIKDHNLSSLAETKEEDIKLMLSRENNCQHHVDKLVQWFCKDCGKGICVECLKYGHEGHLTCTLSNYAATKRTFLSEKLEQLRKREQDMKAKFMAVEIKAVQFQESCEKAKQEVNGTLEKIVDILQTKAVELTNQIDDEFLNAEKMKAEGQCLLNQQQGIISYLSKLLEKGIASEVIEDKEFEEKLDKPDIFQAEEKDYYGLTVVANQALLREANLGLGTLQKLEDKQQKIGSAIACSTVKVASLPRPLFIPSPPSATTLAMVKGKQDNPGDSAFGSPATRGPGFGSPATTAPASWSTQATAPAFGSAATTAPTFGSAATTVPASWSTPSTEPAFGSTATRAPAFGSAAPASGSTPTTAPFRSAATTAPSFGSTQPTASFLFGSTQPTALSFGSTQPTASSFESKLTRVPALGSTQPTASSTGSNLIGVPALGSTQPTASSSGSNLIGVPALGSTQPTAPSFGSKLTRVPALGSTQPTASSTGSNLIGVPALGSTQPTASSSGSNLIGVPALGSTQPTAPSFGSKLTRVPALGSTQPTASSSGSNLIGVPALGSTQPTASSSGSNLIGVPALGSTQPTASSSGSKLTRVPALGSTQPTAPSFGSKLIEVPSFGSAATALGSTLTKETTLSTPSATTSSVSAGSSEFSFGLSTLKPSISLQPCEFIGGDTGKESIQTKGNIKKGVQKLRR